MKSTTELLMELDKPILKHIKKSKQLTVSKALQTQKKVRDFANRYQDVYRAI